MVVRRNIFSCCMLSALYKCGRHSGYIAFWCQVNTSLSGIAKSHLLFRLFINFHACLLSLCPNINRIYVATENNYIICKLDFNGCGCNKLKLLEYNSYVLIKLSFIFAVGQRLIQEHFDILICFRKTETYDSFYTQQVNTCPHSFEIIMTTSLKTHLTWLEIVQWINFNKNFP